MKITKPLIGAAALALLYGTTACTSAGAQSTGSPNDKATNATEVTSHDWDLAFAQCMRQAGLDYPDPKPGDNGAAQRKVDDAEAFEAASKKCTTDVSGAHGERPISDDDRATRNKWNDQYAETIDCLRKKGYEVEALDGGFTLKSEVPDTDLAACQTGEQSQNVETGR